MTALQYNNDLLVYIHKIVNNYTALRYKT